MATIYAYPNPTGSGNCAILASQENYYAPFLSNIGNWNQIRVSAYLSYCGSGSGFQYQTNTENITTSAPNLAWYWGIGSFASPVGLLTPLSTGANFIGISTYGNSNTYFLTQQQYTPPNGGGFCTVSTNSAGARGPVISSSNASFVTASIPSNAAVYVQPTGNTGSVNYCVANTLIFTISGRGQTGQQIFVNLSYDATGIGINAASYTDINSLRIASMNLAGSGLLGNTSVSLYYTTGLVGGGGPLPIPDTVFFHSPFNNNLLRIHNLVVEKYL